MTDVERLIRLQRGPLRLPKNVTAARPQLGLFVTYLMQPATHNALRDAASAWPVEPKRQIERMNRARNDILGIGIPCDHEGLCHLVSRAPQLREVVWFAELIKDEYVLPRRVIPSPELMEICTQVYQKWLEALSRAK